MVQWERYPHHRSESHNSARGIATHFFADGDRGTLQFDPVTLGGDGHDGHHAVGDSSSHKVRGGKTSPLTMVVHGGIGDQFISRWGMGSCAAKTAVIGSGDSDHIQLVALNWRG